ncbi:MAG: regulatory protein RecX [Bacteroidales bacterium]|nr:regulatory protein RecX [Bacteroidales bacterium]
MEYKAALQRAAALCSRQEQCSSQIREKLKNWKVTREDADRILDLLKKENFLDDQRYATHYVSDKFRFNGWGKIKLSAMLSQKGISKDVIEEAMNQIDPELYKQACARLIREKSASLRESNPYKKKGKLFRYAAQRGFESDLIHQILSYI